MKFRCVLTRRLRWLAPCLVALAGSIALAQPASESMPPVLIGFDGAFTQPTSTSAGAIELGAQIAVDHINARGGVLGGRPLKLMTEDNHVLVKVEDLKMHFPIYRD